MAGGQGTRLRPLTCNIPKPMIPIIEKPVMQYIIELLVKYNITEIGVTLQYLPDDVMNYFGNGSEYGVSLKYFIEETPLGTAGSVKSAEDFLDDTFIVISGDSLTDIDISKTVKFHKEKRAMATLMLKEVSMPLEYGVVVTDKTGKISGFIEKPSWGEVISDKVNTGIYIMEPEIFEYYEKNQKFDFSNDLFPILLKNDKPIYGHVAEGYWCDIGSIEQYINCNFDILKGLVNVNINGDKYREGIWVGENCELSSDANIIPPAYIGTNTIIYNDVEVGPFSIFGKNNIISPGATIKRSVIFNNCYIGSNAQVRGSVLCNKVQLESRASVYEDSAIGDDTLISEKAIIKPGVKVWPNKIIESSTVVKSNIIWGGKFLKSLFGKSGVSGEVNVDITPEFVSRLGSAYGSILKHGSRIVISSSDDGAAQMFKFSLATGLLSMGIEVYDLRIMTKGMARLALLFFGVDGGIHVVTEKENHQKINIIFMDKNGLNIEKPLERKIENCFIREDFRRVKSDAFKKITHFSDCIEYYSRQIISKISVSEISEKKFNLIISVKNEMIRSVIKGIMKELKINIKYYEDAKDLVGLSKEVQKSKANLGIYFSDEGESAILIDENGDILPDSMYENLKYLVFLKLTKAKTLVAPVTASSAVEDIAKKEGVSFIRTKSSQKTILDTYLKQEKTANKKELIDAYVTTLDGLNVVMLIIDLMAISNSSISKIISNMPQYYSIRKEIVCPWKMKGKVMRTLIESSPQNSMELIEGVRLNYENAWAIVLPDSDEPLCRVIIEGKSIDNVKNLTQCIIDRIYNIINETEEKIKKINES